MAMKTVLSVIRAGRVSSHKRFVTKLSLKIQQNHTRRKSILLARNLNNMDVVCKLVVKTIL